MVSAGIAHEVIVHLDGKEIFRQNIRVSGGHTQKIVAPSPDNVTTAAATEPAPDSSSVEPLDNPDKDRDTRTDTPSRSADRNAVGPIGPVLMGVGGAVAVAGLVVGGIALKKGNNLDDDYPSGVPTAKKAAVDRVNRMALMTDIMIPAGAAVCVAGFVVWMFQRRKATKSMELALSPVPLVAHDLLGAGLSGSF
jgi:hypothetical protein